MIKINNIETFNFNGAIRGMRNPLNSWDKSDSGWDINNLDSDMYIIGEQDMKLAKNLIKAGTDESKFLRQIFISMDITAPMYWWKEMDTYKVGTVANSCSTMHKLMSKPITIEDFSADQITNISASTFNTYVDYLESLRQIYINGFHDMYEPKDKSIWYSIIQMLPSSYNQQRTWTANYQVLRNIYHARKNHKLQEWHEFCAMIEQLPYAEELICT